MKSIRHLFSYRGRSQTTNNKFLFILCPPYCGSTLMSQIIGSSQQVSVNNPDGTREGQTLPRVKDIMFVDRRWDASYKIDWDFVRTVWLDHWDTRKPILLEKSPPNLVRASEIENAFQRSYFIVVRRNPYAHVESQIRRNGNTAKHAAGFTVRCLQYQQENLASLSNTMSVSYEDLTTAPEKFAGKAGKFLAELSNLNTAGVFSVHNFLNESMPIRNLNDEKIAMLSNDQIEEINTVFKRHRTLINELGYQLLGNGAGKSRQEIIR